MPKPFPQSQVLEASLLPAHAPQGPGLPAGFHSALSVGSRLPSWPLLTAHSLLGAPVAAACLCFLLHVPALSCFPRASTSPFKSFLKYLPCFSWLSGLTSQLPTDHCPLNGGVPQCILLFLPFCSGPLHCSFRTQAGCAVTYSQVLSLAVFPGLGISDLF